MKESTFKKKKKFEDMTIEQQASNFEKRLRANIEEEKQQIFKTNAKPFDVMQKKHSDFSDLSVQKDTKDAEMFSSKQFTIATTPKHKDP